MTPDALKLLPVLLFAFENKPARLLRNSISENEDPEFVIAETIHVYTETMGPPAQDLFFTYNEQDLPMPSSELLEVRFNSSRKSLL